MSTRQVGPYRIAKQLGVGATAITYLAHDTSHAGDAAPLVCLKVLHPAYARNPTFAEAFEREARITRTLHHPHIVTLQDVGRDPRRGPYLVLSFVEGMDLGELLAATRAARTQLDWPIVVLIARHVALALELAHEDLRDPWHAQPRPPVIHRDLCPSNLLLGGVSGAVYVTDFGLARALASASRRPSLELMGRVPYTAPEYIAGEPYDARIDLFSCGVLLFEALTGVRPFSALHIGAHLLQVRNGERRRVEDLRVEFHPSFGAPPPAGLVELVRIIDQLLEPNPADRPTARALADALDAIHIPAGTHRDLQFLVHEHRPPARRDIRLQVTGEHPSIPWSATDSAHLRSRDVEPDELRVTPHGAARLVAAFAHELDDDSDPQVGQAIDATTPDHPSFDVTDTSLPPFDAHDWPRSNKTDWPEPCVIGGEADPLPVIPATRPHPSVPDYADIVPEGAIIPAIASSASGGITSAEGMMARALPAGAAVRVIPTPLDSSTPPPPPAQQRPPPSSAPEGAPAPRFAHRQLALPAVDPGSVVPQRTVRLAAALAALLFVTSFCVLGSTNRILVPLMTGDLGVYETFDHVWTPIFTYGALVGIALGLLAATTSLALWWRARRHTPRRSSPTPR